MESGQSEFSRGTEPGGEIPDWLTRWGMSNPAAAVHYRLTTGEGEHRRCLVHAAERLCSASTGLRPRYSCGLLIPSSHQRLQERGSDASEGYGSSRGNSRVDALTSKEQRPACKRGIFAIWTASNVCCLLRRSVFFLSQRSQEVLSRAHPDA